MPRIPSCRPSNWWCRLWCRPWESNYGSSHALLQSAPRVGSQQAGEEARLESGPELVDAATLAVETAANAVVEGTGGLERLLLRGEGVDDADVCGQELGLLEGGVA